MNFYRRDRKKMAVPKIKMENISKTFTLKDESLEVLKNINLFVKGGEFVSILGPSGCGKSTIFHLLTSLVKEYDGAIEIDGIPLGQWNKRMSYMQQKDLLMPWRTMLENVLLPLELQGMERTEAIKKVEELLPIFGLKGFQEAYPKELSGGMRQRAALLRTVLVDSDIMLLDEPFGALDALNRTNMQQWLLEIWQKFKHSVLFVTHDIEEAIYLSDRVYVLSPRPAEVIMEVNIDFKRPRDKEIVLLPKFLEYKKKLLQALG